MLRINPKSAISLINLILVCSLIIISSCKKGITEPEKNAQDLIQEGWQQFESKDYEDANNSFNKALSLNPVDSVAAIAYCGIGWSQVRMHNYDIAYNNFSFTIKRDSTTPGPYVVHAYVGRAGVFYELNLYNDAVSDATKALNLIGTYEFTHDRTIKFTDLHFLLAQAYYKTLQYSKAQERVDWLRNLFALASINWYARPVIVDGVAYTTYYEALLKAIESLRSKV